MKFKPAFKLLALTMSFALTTAGMETLLPKPAAASGETVSVWRTTKDKSDLLAQKSSLQFGPVSGTNPLTINVDENLTYQSMDGFGASFTEYSTNLIYNKMSVSQRSSLMNELFSTTSGLGTNFLRQPIGSADFAPVFYSLDDMPTGQTDPNLTHFNIDHDLLTVVPVVKQALSINSNIRVLATPWSAPAWMKTNGSLTNGGNLLTNYYPNYANYFVKFIQAYNDQGIPIHYVTPQNEPNNAPSYISMIMNAASENNFIKNNLAPALQSAGLNTKIVAFDNDWSDPNYPLTILQDPVTNPLVVGSAWHWYSGDPSAMSTVHDQYPGKGQWITEASGGECLNQTASWGDIFDSTFKTLVIKGTRNWAKSVTFWNMALDNAGYCRGVVTIDPATGNVTDRNQEYYILGHTSKFIQTDAVRIDSNSFGDGSLMDVAFKNPDGSKVLLVLNDSSASQTFKTVWGNQSFDYTIPSGAVVTFKWSGTQGGTPSVKEAEASGNTIAGGASASSCTPCSGGQKVGNIGTNGGSLQFNGINAASAGNYALTISYTSGEARTATMSVNGGAGVTIAFPTTGSWSTPAAITVPVTFISGNNTIMFSNSTGWAPDFDKINWTTGGNLLTNPGFETGNLSGWSQEFNASLSGLESSYPHGGSYDAYLHPTSGQGVSLAQSIVASRTGTFTVTAYCAASGAAPAIGIDVGGTQVVNMSVTADGAYRQYTQTFSAVAGQTIKVWYYTPAGSGWAVLDDVSVQ